MSEVQDFEKIVRECTFDFAYLCALSFAHLAVEMLRSSCGRLLTWYVCQP
jgi:hypothetical protein